MNVDGIEIDVHVRRGAGVADIRRSEIRIVLQLFQKYFFRFARVLSHCNVFQVNSTCEHGSQGEVLCFEQYSGLDI